MSPKRKLLVANPTIGADIEVFLRDATTGSIVTAEGIIKGTKDAPYAFRDGGFATSLDNVMAEFNIPPVREAHQFRMNILEAMEYIQSILPEGLVASAIPSARVDGKYLQTPNALLFGCEPDFNAWKMGDMNPRPEACDSNLRSCGGHIHIGYESVDREVSMALIRAMDIFIGLPSILQEPDNERKQLYGKAGAFRFKEYGAEYRTVSNYYLQDNTLMEWAFNNTMQAIEFVNSDGEIQGKEAEAIQLAINKNDKKLAQTMCKYFGANLA